MSATITPDLLAMVFVLGVLLALGVVILLWLGLHLSLVLPDDDDRTHGYGPDGSRRRAANDDE